MAFGEEFTNGFPTIGEGLMANCVHHQMCPFYGDFKRFRGVPRTIIRGLCKESSSIRANRTSIMRIEAKRVRLD